MTVNAPNRSATIKVSVVDDAALQRAAPSLQVGRRFVFCTDGSLAAPSGKAARLGGYKQPKVIVKAVVDGERVVLGGAGFVADEAFAPLACLVCDRDLYRVDDDVVRLFVAAAGATSARLLVEMNGAPFTERDVTLEGGVALEALSGLLSGNYSARLVVDGVDVGHAVGFTVAAYSLAPLTARLLISKLDRAMDVLNIELAVETYGVPCDRPLRGTLLGDDVVGRFSPVHKGGGRYSGSVSISGDGPFRVRLEVDGDASRVCEVVLPGTRKTERALVVASELGVERRLSLIDEPGALPVRGGFVTDGDFIATPLVVDAVVVDGEGRIAVAEDCDAVTTAAYCPATRAWTVVEHGPKKQGDVVVVAVGAPMTIVGVGALINGLPFEAMTAFFQTDDGVVVDVPDGVRPGGEAAVRITLPPSLAAKKQRVLVSVRDERLTATDTPQKLLAATLQKNLTQAHEGMGDDFCFHPVQPRRRVEDSEWVVVVTGPNGRDRFAIVADEVVVGRDPSCDIAIADRTFSRRHFSITIHGDRVVITDLGSQNGTWVGPGGGRATAPYTLRYSGDPVVVGRYRFTVEPAQLPEASSGRPPRSEFGDDDERVSSRTMMIDRSELSRAAYVGAHADDSGEGSFLSEDDDDAPPPPPPPRSARPASVDDDDAPTSASLSVVASRAGAGVLDLDDSPVVRADFPEVLCYDLVDVDGAVDVVVRAGDALAAFSVDVFVFGDGAFCAASARFVVDQPVRVDLDVPGDVHPDDKAFGSVRVTGVSDVVTVVVTVDGRAVKGLVDEDGVAVVGAVKSGSLLRFPVQPGVYRASVVDGAERDDVEVAVGEPGVLRHVVRQTQVLQPGQRMQLEGDMLSLRVLPGLDEPFRALVTATAGYGHLCCEQTAAKMLSAVVMCLSADDAALRQKGEDIVLAGVARERSMWRRGRGFAMYPDGEIYPHWSATAARHLWSLQELVDAPTSSAALRAAAVDAVAMADDVARAHRVERVPKEINGPEDAWAVARFAPQRQREALEFVARTVVVDDKGVRLKGSSGKGIVDRLRDTFATGSAPSRVGERVTLCLAGAVLLAAGKTSIALRIANHILNDVDGGGRLYSTVDSVALIALLGQLRKARVGGGATCTVNGKTMKTAEAQLLSDRVEVVAAEEGVVVVEVTRLREERWDSFKAAVPVKVGFHGDRDQSVRRFAKGDRADLVVSLPKGYVAGDLVHVCLPPALAWIHGGGRVKRFTVDFKGKNEVRVPVVVAGALSGKQRYAVALRNMFEEERATSCGALTIEG